MAETYWMFANTIDDIDKRYLQFCHSFDSKLDFRNNEYSLFTSGLRVNPNNTKLLNNLGRLDERNGNYDAAIDYFKRALLYVTVELIQCDKLTQATHSRVEPDDVRAHINLGNIFLKINDSKEAEISYRKATNIVEKLTKNSDQISAIHLTALLRLSELISRDPMKAQEAHLLHQRVLSLRSDFKPALETWTKVVSASNRRIETAVMLAKALEYESSDPDILYNVSHCLIASVQGCPSLGISGF